MIGIKFSAIIPKRRIGQRADIPGGTQRLLKQFATEGVHLMQEYPPWRPWSSPPPKTGPRAGGRRTGMYGRGWQAKVTKTDATVFNTVGYSVYVGGARNKKPGQARALARRGWISQTDAAKLALARARARGNIRLVK